MLLVSICRALYNRVYKISESVSRCLYYEKFVIEKPLLQTVTVSLSLMEHIQGCWSTPKKKQVRTYRTKVMMTNDDDQLR